MKQTVLLFFSLFISILSYSQEIVNVVLVGDEGITEDIKKANAFIVVKKYPNSFQRLDYKFNQPLQKLRTYSDSTLTVLQGPSYEYAFMGWLLLSGNYKDNTKDGDWDTFNDTGKVILTEKYDMGVLIKTVNPDTLKKEKSIEYKDEKEATFKKGDSGWKSYLIKNLNGELAAKSYNGGTVRVAFRVNTDGKCVDAYLRKSVEFVLDEEALRIIETSPLWNPAFQNGKNVNAYRIQPITFVKQ